MHFGPFVFPGTYVIPTVIPRETPFIVEYDREGCFQLEMNLGIPIVVDLATGIDLGKPIKEHKLPIQEASDNFIKRSFPALFNMSSIPLVEDGEQMELPLFGDIYKEFRDQVLIDYMEKGVITRKQAKDILIGALYGKPVRI